MACAVALAVVHIVADAEAYGEGHGGSLVDNLGGALAVAHAEPCTQTHQDASERTHCWQS